MSHELCSHQPEHNNFTRYISFKNYQGNWKRLAVGFGKTSNLVYENHDFPNGIDVLKSLADNGNRSYWDSMYLENRGGSTALPLAHVFIEMNYNNPSGSSPRGIDHGKIPIVDWPYYRTLKSGNHRLSLNYIARASRKDWAGVLNSAQKMVRWAAEDIGKSGSDGRDSYGNNPKYGGEVRLLCSEFVSWYYHEAGVRISGNNFRDITGTQTLHDMFSSSKRLYFYKNSDNTWRRVDDSTKRYTPKAGDYLERRGPAGAEHSMIVLRWDSGNKEAIVFNGPWPVTLRRVRIHHDEQDNDKTFFIGRVTF
jgi:hypothetical protein